MQRDRAHSVKTAAQLKALSEGRWHDSIGPESGVDESASFEPEHDPTSLINLLSPRLREALVLRVVERLAYKDIAARLTISCAAARKRVQHARAALRALRKAPADARPPATPAPPSSSVRTAKRSRARNTLEEHPDQAAVPPAIPRTVRVQLQSGLESEVEILLDARPSREGQKIPTRRAYFPRQPAGWKMRLKLA